MVIKNPKKKEIWVIRGVNARDRFVEFEGYPAKVMVCACIGPGFKSDLIRVQGKLKGVD